MSKTQLTALVNTVVTRYTPSVYSTVTSQQTRNLVELKYITSGTVIIIDQVVASDILSPEISYKIGSDYYVAYVSHFTVAIAQELNQYVFVETATPTNSYIIAALNQAAAETIASNAGKVGTVTTTLVGKYFGTAGIITSAI